MNSDTIKYVLQDFVGRPLPTVHPRELVLPTDSGKVIGLAGVRRSGKTFLFFDTMRRLIVGGLERRRVLYLNFEDDRLQPLEAPDLDLVMRSVHELYPETASGPVYLFLDEVQNAPGWERWVRRIADTEPASLFVTGSSSRMLTKDLGSAMRGRSVTYEVLPLSFREFLAFRGLRHVTHSARSESAVRRALEEYLRWGAFPEVVLAEEAMRPLILEEYASVMLHHDLVERHHVRNQTLLRALLRHCFRHTASLLSVSKLQRDFRSLGMSFSKDTLFEFLAMVEDAGLVFLLPKHEASAQKQAQNPRKMHVVDAGLVAAYQARAEIDVGHKLESAVYLECRRRQKDWHYYAKDAEVDLCDPAEQLYVNVCWRLADMDTVDRERAGMALGAQSLPGARGYLLYHEFSSDALSLIPGATPAWQWLLAPLDAWPPGGAPSQDALGSAPTI